MWCDVMCWADFYEEEARELSVDGRHPVLGHPRLVRAGNRRPRPAR